MALIPATKTSGYPPGLWEREVEKAKRRRNMKRLIDLAWVGDGIPWRRARHCPSSKREFYLGVALCMINRKRPKWWPR